jgi:hypothetical protein
MTILKAIFLWPVVFAVAWWFLPLQYVVAGALLYLQVMIIFLLEVTEKQKKEIIGLSLFINGMNMGDKQKNYKVPFIEKAPWEVKPGTQ